MRMRLICYDEEKRRFKIMSRIAENLTDLIGNTPLVRVSSLSRLYKLKAEILVKLEYFNPAGSAKDRIALAMIEAAEREGRLKEGGLIIEPTSGNTGVGLALVAAVKGYRLILTMPETMSIERRRLLAARGAEIVLTPGSEGMGGAIRKAIEINKNNPGSIILQQFANSANAEMHERTTGPEIIEDTDGSLDAFVAGVGTGGSISGVGRALKNFNSDIRVIAVEPDDSPVLSGGQAGPHKIQGIGAGFIPENYDASVVDEILRITTADAVSAARALVRYEGILVGISSGAAFAAAIKLAEREEFAGKRIVVLLADGGERYMSTGLFGNETGE